MSTYTLKISSQGQLTLPRKLREKLHAHPGSRITVTATDDGTLKILKDPPITKHFNSLSNTWTKGEQDASEYSRKLRNSMQPKL